MRELEPVPLNFHSSGALDTLVRLVLISAVKGSAFNIAYHSREQRNGETCQTHVGSYSSFSLLDNTHSPYGLF